MSRRIKNVSNAKKEVIHVDRLRKYFQTNDDTQLTGDDSGSSSEDDAHDDEVMSRDDTPWVDRAGHSRNVRVVRHGDRMSLRPRRARTSVAADTDSDSVGSDCTDS